MSSPSKSSRLITMLIIDITFLALELAVGIALGSLALMADAFHMLNDIISLSAGLWAVLVAQSSTSDKYSFGYLRAEILGAFFNAVFLIALCVSIILEAAQRLLDPPKINNPKLILVVGVFGLASNLAGFFILGGHSHSHGVENFNESFDHESHSHKQNCDVSERDTEHENHQADDSYQTEHDPLITKKSSRKSFLVPSLKNKKLDKSHHEEHNHKKPNTHKHGGHDHSDLGMDAMILHVIGDALGNIGVIISGLIIWLTQWHGRYYADPAVSLFITLIILRSAIPLTIESAKVLLQATPDHIEVETIKKDVESLPGITNCHHIHIWQLSGTQLVASMHIHFEFSMNDTGGEKYMDAARAVRKCLHAHGIHSVTIQPEFSQPSNVASNSDMQMSSSLDSSIGQLRYNLVADKCLLECVDNCQGKPCCNPKPI
ncbi:putative cd2+ zn2+ transporter protein [Erysiphe necator]|uniref:Putative cd2+ zn2+ transporter protein n=1 Tax=Uncinula necator TaxID=52586 RepID=A0A0B1PGX4_UNCNE|nr:putative cd2+ zn2+ transporter protein [Erysiphe necator]